MAFEEAKHTIRTADHILYVTYPVLKENRLLIKALEEINNAVVRIIEEIMNREYSLKNIKIYSDARTNFTTFEQFCVKKYGLSEELEGIKQILHLFNAHKSSSAEFSRPNKFVIMSDSLKTESLTLQRIKEFLVVAKNMLKKSEEFMKQQ